MKYNAKTERTSEGCFVVFTFADKPGVDIRLKQSDFTSGKAMLEEATRQALS